MAIYDLQCEECGHTFELYVNGFLREEDKVCPECQSVKVSQKYTGFFGIGSSWSGGSCGSSQGGGFS